MMNMKLINETIKLVNAYFEAENIMVSNQIIEAQAIDWYNHSEIVEPEMLAAAVMNYGNYKFGTTWNELEQLCEFYFPTISVEEMSRRIGGFETSIEGEEDFDETEYEEYIAMSNFHIGEIEAAQRDAIWQ